MVDEFYNQAVNDCIDSIHILNISTFNDYIKKARVYLLKTKFIVAGYQDRNTRPVF